MSLLDRFLTLYGEPKTDNPALFVSEYRRALKGYDSAVLDRAGDIVVKAHRYPTWPTLGEVIATANRVAEEIAIEREREQPRPATNHDLPEPSPEEKERADEITRRLMAVMRSGANTFLDIKARCPVGGTIDVSAPWGEEVRDSYGNVVPIVRKGAAA